MAGADLPLGVPLEDIAGVIARTYDADEALEAFLAGAADALLEYAEPRLWRVRSAIEAVLLAGLRAALALPAEYPGALEPEEILEKALKVARARADT